MNLGLLTYFRADVAGQYYQALATLNALLLGFAPAAQLVNIRHEKRAWRPSLRPEKFLPSIVQHGKYAIARKRELTPYVKQPLLQDNSRRSVLNYLRSRQDDVLVVGADTCLKVDHYFREELPYFWLDEELEAKKVMLSASAEFTHISDLSQEQRKKAERVLGGFRYLGVRDDMTADLFQAISPGLKIRLMPDPTFSLDVKSTGLPCLERLKTRKRKKLCGVNLADTSFTRELVEKLGAEYHIVSINCPKFPGGSRIMTGPNDWLHMFGSFDLVVTGSFHETVFSLKNNIPVVGLDSNVGRLHKTTKSSKIYSLLSTAKFLDQYVSPHRGHTLADALSAVAVAKDRGREAMASFAGLMRSDYLAAMQEARTVCA